MTCPLWFPVGASNVLLGRERGQEIKKMGYDGLGLVLLGAHYPEVVVSL